MLRLAVTTDAETFERMRDPLSSRGVDVRHLRAKERAIRLTASPTETFDMGFVYPTRLMEGGALDFLHDIPWVNDRDAVLTSRNKAGVIAALSQADVPVPETTMVSNPLDDERLFAAAEVFDGPVVVKPNSTTRGTGIVRVDDADSLSGVADYLRLVHDYHATGDKSYLLQEFLPDARDYRAMVVDGDCVGGVERRLPAEACEDGRWKHNVHRGAEAAAVELPERHRRLAEEVAGVLDIPYLGVDLLETEDRLLVGETNARPTIDDDAKYDSGFYDRLAALVRRQIE
ncbi:ATP-grasp domain-containing protein [Haloprofundus salilacus]|uniref:ATP-grasp domain-containing protein n=1 Tax=Haloprofundus salilacus TaxID=2876190 RepID=UPI001CCA5AB0|nr:RimK family alpha-L-glutamate ligase [Haloprofundus salilacus]